LDYDRFMPSCSRASKRKTQQTLFGDGRVDQCATDYDANQKSECAGRDEIAGNTDLAGTARF
jgi:hypothetical protein